MKTFKEFSDNAIVNLVKYIKENSYLDNLNLSVSNGEQSGFKSHYANYEMKCYDYKIYNNALSKDIYLAVSVAMWGTTCRIQVRVTHLHSFGLNSLISNFEFYPTSKSSVELTLDYKVNLENSDSITIDTKDISGNLKVKDSSFSYDVRQEGVVSLKKELSYGVLLSTFNDMLLKSNDYLID